MINVIKRILQGSNYKFIIEEFSFDGEQYLFGGSREKNQYLLFTHIKEGSINKFTDEQNYGKIFDSIQPLKSYNAHVDKNLSLIIAIEVNKLLSIPLNQYLEIEENPYYFRKYVLPFTRMQLHKFKEMVFEIPVEELKSHLELQIKNTNDFKKYTENLEDDSIYNLLCKFFIKIPFLTVNPEKKDNAVLSANIEKRLTPIQKELIEKINEEINTRNLNLEESVDNGKPKKKAKKK